MQTRSEQFDELVLDAAERLERRLGQRLEEVELAVEEVPPSDPAPWESGVPLGRLFPRQGSEAARIVLYRRPVETRANDQAELVELVNDVVVEQVAALLGRDPEELDPRYDEGEQD
jgi:predicted Zn-dependent protease with MMP-like domain